MKITHQTEIRFRTGFRGLLTFGVVDTSRNLAWKLRWVHASSMQAPFTRALRLAAPRLVPHVDFQRTATRIVRTVDCAAKRLACAVCDAATRPIHDRFSRPLQHLHFFQHRAVIEAKVPRVGRRECFKTIQIEVPWSRAVAGFTETLEAFVVALCTRMPVTAVPVLLGVSDDRAWRVLDFRVKAVGRCEEFSRACPVSADERGASKKQRVLRLLCDLSTRGLFFAALARTAGTFKAFAVGMAARGDYVKATTGASLDLGTTYQAGRREPCSNAKISFDPLPPRATAVSYITQKCS